MAVCENQQYRWLLMANTIQTVMDLHHPHKLVLPHLHGMLLSLYFNSSPQKVLELGLGGGALQRFFGHHMPRVQRHSIELDEQIITYFRQYFSDGLHVQHNHLTQGDAREHIKTHSNVSLLFVDLFSGNAPPEFVNDKHFYEDCLACLARDGVIIINLLPVGEIQTLAIQDMLTTLTGFQPAIFSIPQYKNRIIMSAPFPLGRLPFDQKLQQLANQYQLDLMNVIQLR